MRKFTKVIAVAAFLFTLLLSPSVKATHFKGGDIYFQCVGNGVYKLIFTCYYSCEQGSSLPYDPSTIGFTLTSTCSSVPTSLYALSSASSVPDTLPLYCPGVRTTCTYYANGTIPPGTPDGTMYVNYITDTFSIPSGCTVTAEIDQGSRNGAVTNLIGASGYDIDIVASVTTPSNGNCTNNPEFAAYPVNVFCVNQNADFSQGAIDLNGDSLVYTLINPRSTGGSPIPFQAGCSATNPLGAPNVYASTFTFNSRTGNINFTPTQSGNYVLAVRVDAYRSGVLISSTMRDIQIVVVPCSNGSIYQSTPPPYLIDFFKPSTVTGGIIYDSTQVGVCPGSLLQFTLRATTTALSALLRDSAAFATVLPGSTVSLVNSGGLHDTATLSVSWIPQNSDSGFHYLYITISDTSCPKPGKRTYAFNISVLSGLYAGPNLIYCNGGQPVTISAHGANHYIWTDSATGGPPVGLVSYSSDSSSIMVSPGTNAGYIVHGDLIGGCKNLDTVTVFNVPLFSLTTHAQDSAICKYTSTVISVTANPASVGPFTYMWTPGAGVLSPTSPTTATAPLKFDTWFRIKATSVAGCVITDSVQVRVQGAAPRLSITPNTNNVCPGDTITLNGVAFAENLVICGQVSPLDTCPDNTILSTKTVGPDSSSTTSTESPYSGFYPSARSQYLITAAEMNAAGLSSGAVTDISFFVSQINSTLGYDSFTVSMGCTSLDSLRGFVNNLTEVAPATQVFPNLGWTPHPFTHFYNWDGASNLVIQICYTRSGASFDDDDYVGYSTTRYNGSVVYARDFGSGANGCALNSNPTISRNRPNIRVGMCSPNVLKYQWTPTTLLCDTCPTTQVVVRADSTYKLTVYDHNCVNDSSFRVLINKNIAINATPDTTLCNADTVRLNVALTNAPPAVCLQNYSVSSIPYSAITGATINIAPAAYLDDFGFNSTDEGTAGPYNLGFSFPFYCEQYSSFWVNTNGWITFEDPNLNFFTGYVPQTLPTTAANLLPEKLIALMWDDYDLAPSGTGNVKYLTSGTAPNRILVVKFNAIGAYLVPSMTTTGEIHLHEGTGVIDILIQSSNYTGLHTTGLKDSTGLGIAAPGRNNANYIVTTPEAWRFTPQNGANVALSQTVWSPNSFISDTSIVSPLVYPPSSQTYVVDETLILNQFTYPTTCHVRDSVTVKVGSFAHNVTASPLTICPGDSSRLTFTSTNTISSYHWTPSSLLSDSASASTLAIAYDTTQFYVTAIDLNGCTGKDSVTVNVIPTPHPHVNPDSTICFTDSVLLTVSGTYNNYQWFKLNGASANGRDSLSTAASIYARPPGDYQVRVLVSGATCYYFSDTAHIDSFPHPQLLVTASGPTSFCVGGNVVLETTQGLNNYQWTPAGGGAQAIPVTTSGDYSYIAYDQNNCKLFSDTVRVRAAAPPEILHTPIKDPLCTNETDTVTVTTVPSGVPIFWHLNGAQVDSGNTYVITRAGTYDIIADGGCPTDSTFVVTVAASPVASFTLPAISACGCDTSIPVSPVVTPVSASTTFTWSDGSHGSSYSIDTTGIYTVTVSDANHCTASASISAVLTCPQVSVTALPDTIFPSDTTTLSVLPVGSTVLSSYQWTPAGYVISPSSASTSAISQHPGTDTFQVVVTDNNGCTNRVSVIITVIEQGNFRMPTAFTPNGDSKNDKFYPILNGPNSTSKVISFRIYNRWGQLLYDNPNPTAANGWDGGYGGNPQATDTYMYFITIESPDPNDVTKRIQKSTEGNFQLFR